MYLHATTTDHVSTQVCRGCILPGTIGQRARRSHQHRFELGLHATSNLEVLVDGMSTYLASRHKLLLFPFKGFTYKIPSISQSLSRNHMECIAPRITPPNYSLNGKFASTLSDISGVITPPARAVMKTAVGVSVHKSLRFTSPNSSCGAAHFGFHGRCNRGARQWRSRRTHG